MYSGIVEGFLEGLDSFLAFTGPYGAIKADEIPSTFDDIGFYHYVMDGDIGRKAVG